MKNYCALTLLLILQTANLYPFSEKDRENFSNDVTKVFVTQLCGLLIPKIINNPPKTNFKEFFTSIFYNTNSEIDAEIELLTNEMLDLKEKISTCEDYTTKRQMKSRKKEIKNRLYSLNQTKNAKVMPIKWNTSDTSITNEAAAIQNAKVGVIQEGILNSLSHKNTNN